jgi:hypothetical protein
MLGHDYIAINVESVTTPYPTGGPFKPAFGLSGAVTQLDRVFPPLFRIVASFILTQFCPSLTAVTGFGSASNIPHSSQHQA